MSGDGREEFSLRTERVGPLPIVNHFLTRLGLVELLEKHVPTTDRRSVISHAKVLGVLVRSILVEREPIYRQQEIVETFAPGAFGLTEKEVRHLSDDRIGRALDRLFDADRGTMLTQVVIAMGERFEVRLNEQHNDTTTIKFCGQYREAKGRSIRGKCAPWITYGHSKDHRPDLKQLLFVMTASADGAVPTQFRCENGNDGDSRTHIETWEALCAVHGKPEFLYVADSKLCTRENMDYIHYRGGRFVTVLPRTRAEDSEFREWVQDNTPGWEKVRDLQNPVRKHGPRDRWFVCRASLPSREGWPVTWVYSSLLALRQEKTRREQIAAAVQQLQDLKARLAGPKARVRTIAELHQRIDKILRDHRVSRYLTVRHTVHEEHSFRQRSPGRPGPDTSFKRVTRQRLDISWEIDEAAVEYDRTSDGMYPLLTNDRTLSPRHVLEAHKRQPSIEKRFSHIKTVHNLAPVFLKNEGRIEAFFFVYFLVLMLHALIEREVRKEMAREKIKALELYPEERSCKHPSTDHVLRLFAFTQRHCLIRSSRVVQVFHPQLTELQQQVLRLLGMRKSDYT